MTRSLGVDAARSVTLLSTVLDEFEIVPTDGGVAIPLAEIQPPDAEEEISLNTDEPASVAIIKLPRAGLIRPLMIVRFADWLHWIGKSLAIVNAIGIIANSVFMYAGVYETCYCNSNVFYWGLSHAFDIVSVTQSAIDLSKSAWIGAFMLGLTCCTFFVGTNYLIRDSL